MRWSGFVAGGGVSEWAEAMMGRRKEEAGAVDAGSVVMIAGR